jgi:uncharacterized membrane protein
MSRQIGVIIVSAALLAGLSGIAQADDAVHHRGQAARAAAPGAEAILRKLPDQRITGLAVAKPQSGCSNIACAGYSGVGF